MRFFIVGPNQGKSGTWGGFTFTKGVLEMAPGPGADNARILLGRYYSAYPESELVKDKEGNLMLASAFQESADAAVDETVKLEPVGEGETPAPDKKNKGK